MSGHLAVGTPPVLYLPCRAAGEPGEQPQVVRRTTRDGRTALVAYTALDRLHAACGPGHPWALLSLHQLEELFAHEPYDVVHLDLVMPEGLQVPAAGAGAGEPASLPPVLYVPCIAHVARLEDAALEYIRGQDGLVGLPVFTSLDRLRTGLGHGQPWILVETSRLGAVHALAPYDRLLLDETITVTGTEGGWG